MGRIARLFVIKTRWEAWAVIYALALGAVERGQAYREVYPGAIGWLFFVVCTAAVFMAGGILLDATRRRPAEARTRASDLARAG